VDEPASAARVRWTDPLPPETGGQLALFETPERIVGRGEYRGLEFVHVRARTIINHLAVRARVPFGFTINAYRRCSHACTSCFARPSHEYLGLNPATDLIGSSWSSSTRSSGSAPSWRLAASPVTT
jgi:hypothetical protein